MQRITATEAEYTAFGADAIITCIFGPDSDQVLCTFVAMRPELSAQGERLISGGGETGGRSARQAHDVSTNVVGNAKVVSPPSYPVRLCVLATPPYT